MDRDRIFEGRDLEQALHAAAAKLGIAEPDLDYEILEQGRRGLFGVGAKNVRIRVMPPVEAVPPQDKPELQQPERQQPERQQTAPAGGETEERSGSRTRNRRSRRSRRGRRGERPAGERATPQPPRPPQPLTPEARELEGTVQQMIDLMGLELVASAQSAGVGVDLELSGPDESMLSKKDSELRAAIQFLLNRMARRAWPDMGRINLGNNGGRSRGRDDEVVERVREVAEQVSRTGRTRRLQAMNGYERRLAHITVRKFADLGSKSEGDGSLKKVKIYKNKK